MKEKRCIFPSRRLSLPAIWMLLWIFAITTIRAQVPSNFYLEALAGGKAPWEGVVKLTIDSAGNGRYYIIYPQDRRTGSATLIRTFTLGPAQLDSIVSSLSAHNFFSLDTLSDGGYYDGDYVGLHVRANLNERRVLAVNSTLAPLDSIIRNLNSITPDTLDLHYNALDAPSAPLARPQAVSGGGSTVVNDGCTTLITVKLDLLGDSVDLATALKIKHSIEDKWNAGAIYGAWCPIRMRVIVHLGEVNSEHHQIKIVPGSEYFRSYVWRLTQLNGGSSTSGKWWIRAGDDNTAAHEVGHLIGFEDEYTENFWGTTSTTNPGHENDLMATLTKPEGRPRFSVLDSLIRAAGINCPDYCCTQYTAAVPYGNHLVDLPKGSEVDQIFSGKNNVIEAATTGGIWDNRDTVGAYQLIPGFGTNQFNVNETVPDSVGDRLPLDVYHGNGIVIHLNPNPWGFYPQFLGNVFGGTPPLGESIIKGLGTVAGDPLYALSNRHVYISPDYGASWQVDSAGLLSGTISDICYGPDGYLYATTSNGLFVQSPDSIQWRQNTAYNGLHSSSRIFVDRTGRIFIATFSGTIGRSLDTGRTWQYSTYPSTPFVRLSDDAFGNVYGMSINGALYRSQGGTSGWKRFDASLTSLTVSAPFIHDLEGDSILYAATSLGLFKSTDQGLNWLEANGSLPAQRVYGFLKLPTGRVITSTDLGIFTKDLGNWVKRYPTIGYLGRLPVLRDGLGNLYSVQTNQLFPPSLSNILKSTDDGTSWHPDTSTLSGTTGTLFYVDELGNQHLATTFASAQPNPIIFQRPLGGSWTPDTTGLGSTNNSSTQSMVSDGQGTLFVSGQYPTPKIFRRPISGGAWILDTTGVGPFRQMIPGKKGEMFAAGFVGIYYRGIAGGTWQPMSGAGQPAGATALVLSVDSSGFLFGAFAQGIGSSTVGRGVYFTAGNGAKWTYAGFDSMNATGLVSYGDTTYLGAERGLYTVTHTPALSVSEAQLHPSQFILAQNFPNPFNPATLVQYGLPGRSRVVLKVYNTIGQVVRTLVDRIEEAGNYSARFDAGGLPSGVYFCRMEAANTTDPRATFLSVKKMLLIR